MERVILTLKSSPEQQAALEAFLQEQQDSSSPHFHEWLTPEQFGERFGASPEEIESVANWLRAHGLRINQVSNSRLEIEFSGTARQIEAAFQTEIHHYDFNGEMHVANANDISIPEALAPVVGGMVSLHDFKSKPKLQRREATPNFNFAAGRHGVAPYDFATIYDVAALWNEGNDGSGQTIAVVGRSNLNLDDVAAFRSQYGLPANTPQVILNGPDPLIVNSDEEGEADLDVEWSGAVAKGATIKFVVSKSTMTDGAVLSERYIVNNNVAPVLTTSFGFCETISPSTSQFYASLWQQAAAQGISVFVAAGDSGSASCDDPSTSPAKGGNSVDGEAATPYNVAVGGTQFNENGSDSVYWNTTNNAQNRSSAKAYIPEVVWNESGSTGLWSGGGGVSTVHATPSWQTGYGVPTVDPGTTNQHHRYVPDVSLTAAGHDGYVIQQRSSLFLVSGTSASAPAFAGIMAIVNQVTKQANGNPNPRIYALAAQVPSAFHDITSGTNSVPCADGTPNWCVGGMTTGYTAGPGYDLATGWGSVDAYVFVHGFAGGSTAPPLTITSSSPLNSGLAGTGYTVTLTASGGTPPYQWTVASGSSLPPGLTLSAAGVLSGTPSMGGPYSFTVNVTDSASASASQAFQITIMTQTTGGGPSSATANTYHIFPQFADGQNPGDGTYYRSTLMISNPNSSSTNCTLQLRGLTVPGFNLNYSLGPNGWTIASTSGTQNLKTGYATLQCSAKVEAQLLYSFYLSNGIKLSEATVFSSPPAATVRVIADETGGAQLGLAIANDSVQSVTYTITVTGASAPATLTLPARTSMAKYLREFVPGIPPNNLGAVQVSSTNGTASVIGLRFTGPIFTTIPESLRSSATPTANTYHVFPQFADGKQINGTYYETTRIYMTSGTAANCTTQLRGVTTNGLGQFTGNLPPDAFVVSSTSGTDQAIQSGYATLQCSTPVDAQEIYSYYAADGTKLSEATVFSSPAAKSVQILADSREGAQIGLAIANDSGQPSNYTIVATDSSGAVVGSVTQTISAWSSVAKFLSEFMQLPPNYFGSVIVSSDTGTASIIGLRYTGNVFTTIPETIRP